jgi:hypothetical protein
MNETLARSATVALFTYHPSSEWLVLLVDQHEVTELLCEDLGTGETYAQAAVRGLARMGVTLTEDQCHHIGHYVNRDRASVGYWAKISYSRATHRPGLDGGRVVRNPTLSAWCPVEYLLRFPQEHPHVDWGFLRDAYVSLQESDATLSP